ncbi:unnamed protein product [Paramecium primaurelia]|uniref:Uncharacterized protein n=1 Tax=Paramecium primaurelia TaxID=5886 RepID=A0A8S1LQX4_PARPR|nr:unnamed protein product [Paramecium primaurelia]
MFDLKRKRLLTNDDLNNQNIIPKTPVIKTLKDTSILLPDLQLTYEIPNCFNYIPITIIPEDVRLEKYQLPWVSKYIKKRQRFQNENLSHRVINMMERQLLSRNSQKLPIDNYRF